MTKELFISKKDNFPDLFFDTIIFETYEPILFTCKDKLNNHYIVSCHKSTGDVCEWIVSPISLENLLGLYCNRVSIRKAFCNIKNGFIVTLNKQGYSFKKTENINHEELNYILPSENIFLDTDEGEFKNEIEELKAVIN